MGIFPLNFITCTRWLSNQPQFVWKTEDYSLSTTLLLMIFTYLIMSKGLRFFLIPNWIRKCWQCLCLPPRLSTQCMICLTLAQLFNLTAKQPKLAPIESFDDIIASNIQIFAVRDEFDLLENHFRARYADAFRPISNVPSFLGCATVLTPAMPTPSQWLGGSIFGNCSVTSNVRYSELCFVDNSPQSFILSENSIYYTALKLFTLRIQQSGIINHWLHHSLYDMAIAGHMDLRDYSAHHPMQSLNMEDFQLFWRC